MVLPERKSESCRGCDGRLPTHDRQIVGRCGQWSSAPPTTPMNWSAAVGQEIGPNDRSDLQAIAGSVPLLSFALSLVESAKHSVAPSDCSMTSPRPNQVHAWGLKVSSTLGEIHVYISTAPKVEKQMDADSLFGIPVPKSISALHRGEITNNEVTSPGLGFTIPYHGPMIEATLYIYDLGLNEIPANPLDDAVRQHFDGAHATSSPCHDRAGTTALP